MPAKKTARKKTATKREGTRNAKPKATPGITARQLCSVPQMAERTFQPNVSLGRMSAILVHEKKWANFTSLHYCFLNVKPWKGAPKQQQVVRDAFAEWKSIGMGLDFTEVSDPAESEIRIGFQTGDGSWSYVGRDALHIGTSERTLNFGWDLTRDPDTALHEIGHALGMPHEHQNPHAGIVWNEAEVYRILGGPPNHWSRQTTYHNILRKLEPDQIRGGTWDKDSIMHYPFGPGMIQHPAQYQTGLQPAPGLSDRDRMWVQAAYPPEREERLPTIKPFGVTRLAVMPGQQRTLKVRPNATRAYTIQTFGKSDTVMVLFEQVEGERRFVAGDDDSGVDRNARITVRLRPERQYLLGIRLFHEGRAGETHVMMW